MAKLPITPSKGLSSLLKFGYGVLDDLGFFSRAEKVIDLLPPKAQVGKGSDIITKIEELGGKQVKDELLFTGLKDEFIETPRVTSQELKDYLNKNKTRIQEKVRSQKKVDEQDVDDLQNTKELQEASIFYGRPETAVEGVDQGVPEWVFTEGLETGGGIDSFTQGSTTITDIQPDVFKSTISNLLDFDKDYVFYKDNALFGDTPISFSSSTNDKNMAYNNLIADVNESKLPFIEITKDGSNIKTIGNNEMGWLTYLSQPEGDISRNFIIKSNSLNEAQLQANKLLLDHERTDLRYKSEGASIDLSPKHENYTVGGGDNYQEIILTAQDKQDKYLEKVGDIPEEFSQSIKDNFIFNTDNARNFSNDFKDYFDKTKGVGINNKYSPFYSMSKQEVLDVFKTNYGIDEKNLSTLEKLVRTIPFGDSDKKPYKILELINKGKLNFEGSNSPFRGLELTDNGEIFATKGDYSVDVHFPEKNIIVYARTKDRIDEDNGKNLATEELQSDLGQRGRATKEGMAFGKKELKQIINKKSPVVHGDLLDAYNDLKEISNIGDIKFNAMLLDERDLNFSNVFRNPYINKFFDSTRQFTDKNFNKFSIPELINSSQSKYKFHHLKDRGAQNLTEFGFTKLDDAPNITQFYANKKTILPAGERSPNIIAQIKENYETPLSSGRDYTIYDTYQSNKNKLYSNIEDFTNNDDFTHLADRFIQPALSQKSNALSRNDLMLDVGADSFFTRYNDDGTATINENRSSFIDLFNPYHVVKDEFSPTDIAKYDAYHKSYIENDVSIRLIKDKLMSEKDLDGQPLLKESDLPLSNDELFEKYKKSKMYERGIGTTLGAGSHITKYLEKESLPRVTVDRMNANIDKMNNFIKKHDGLKLSDSGKRFKYDDYLKAVDEDLKNLPVYPEGLKEYMQLKAKTERAISRVAKIINFNNSEIGEGNYFGGVSGFKFDFGNNPDEVAFDKLKNFDIANEKLRFYRETLEKNSRKEIPSLPFIGDSKKFAEVGIKRLILKGIEEGYDSVSVLPAHVHTERWRTPSLRQFYDVTLPSVIKDILRGTGQQAQIKKVFPDVNVKQRYNELKKLESVTDELMNTTFNNKSNIAKMSANDMFQYLTTNTTNVNLDGINISKPTPLSGALQDADAKNDITSIINKDMFFNNAVTREGLEDMLSPQGEDMTILRAISNRYEEKYGEKLKSGDILNRLRVLKIAHKKGINNVDDLMNGTIFKQKQLLSNTNEDEKYDAEVYNNFIDNMYVGDTTSGENAYLPSITIKLTPELKEYAQSGISLYTSLPVAVGAGAVTAQQILGTEEDIVEEEDDVL